MSGREARDRIEVTVGLPVQDLITALRQMDPEDREDLIEDLLAAISPDYVGSIEQARKDWREGRVKTHDQLFGSSD